MLVPHMDGLPDFIWQWLVLAYVRLLSLCPTRFYHYLRPQLQARRAFHLVARHYALVLLSPHKPINTLPLPLSPPLFFFFFSSPHAFFKHDVGVSKHQVSLLFSASAHAHTHTTSLHLIPILGPQQAYRLLISIYLYDSLLKIHISDQKTPNE